MKFRNVALAILKTLYSEQLEPFIVHIVIMKRCIGIGQWKISHSLSANHI